MHEPSKTPNIDAFRKITDVATHAGVFHADDVLSTAFLKILNPNIVVHRVFSVPEGMFAYDIGNGRFDHHSDDSEVRDNGIKYAAFGLLWREFGAEYLGSEKAAKDIEDLLAFPVDLHDNGEKQNLLSISLSSFNPSWSSSESFDDNFFDAVSVAEKILRHILGNKIDELKAEERVRSASRLYDNRVVWLETFCPWQEWIGEEVEYAVFPSSRGGLNIQAAPVSPGSFASKRPFPEEWRGKPAEVLENEVSGLTFVHPNGFICGVTDADAAKRVLDVIYRN